MATRVIHVLLVPRPACGATTAASEKPGAAKRAR